jgi:hypothetical protein
LGWRRDVTSRARAAVSRRFANGGPFSC